MDITIDYMHHCTYLSKIIVNAAFLPNYSCKKVGPHEGSCRRYMSREHVEATNSRLVHTRSHVAGMCSRVLLQRQNYNKYTHET